MPTFAATAGGGESQRTAAAADQPEGHCTAGYARGTRRLRTGDSGPEIAPKDRERLFDPFFTTKTSDGTGLGLSVSLSLVQRYDVRIEAD